MDQIDIIEIYNGRAVFQNKGPEATTFARLNNIPCAASSDAHGEKGMASVYSQISHKPTKIIFLHYFEPHTIQWCDRHSKPYFIQR